MPRLNSDVHHSSLALISARATVTSIDILSMLSATYLYNLCQGKAQKPAAI